MWERCWKFQALKFQDEFCVLHCHASACLKKQDRNQSTPLCFALYLTTSVHVLHFCCFLSFFYTRLLCLLFAFSCITKISTLSGGWLMVLSKLSLFFFKSFASRDFPLHLCHCHMPPFFLCSSLFSALCRFLCHHIWQSALMTQHPLICF